MVAWGIIVGLNTYEEISKLRPLHGAVADAVDFADWLLDPEGGDLAPQNLYLWSSPAPDPAACTARVAAYLQNVPNWPLVGPDFQRPPRTAELISGISEINKLANNAGADRLYVFFAGHGAQTQAQNISEEPQNCFITGDYIPGVEAVGLINCDDMKRYLKNQGPRELVLFLDCCRNELPLRVSRPTGGFSFLAEAGNHERLCIGRAAQDEMVAYEVPLLPAQAERGAFTQLLTYGLREVRNGGGELTLPELDKYVTEALKEVVKPNFQIPDFDERPKPPAIVLATSAPKGVLPSIRFNLSALAAGTQVELRDGNDQLIDTLVAHADPIVRALPRGAYTLEQAGILLAGFNHIGPGAPDVVL